MAGRLPGPIIRHAHCGPGQPDAYRHRPFCLSSTTDAHCGPGQPDAYRRRPFHLSSTADAHCERSKPDAGIPR